MMPFGSECCKGAKLLVDLFLESYTRCTTQNGMLQRHGPNYLWEFAFWSRTQGVPLTMEF